MPLFLWVVDHPLARALAIALSCGGAAIASQTTAPPVPAAPPASAVPFADAARAIHQLVAERRFVEAAQASERLVKERPTDPEAWLLLANVHLSPDWSFRRDVRAASAAEKALKLAGRRVDIVSVLAIARARLVDYDAALALIAEMCDAVPPASPKLSGEPLSDLLVCRADILLKRDATDAAARARVLVDLERAIAASPHAAQPRLMRAEALMNVDRHAEALVDLEVAVQSQPGNKQVHAALRNACSRLGKRDEARHHYEIWKRLNRLTDSVATVSSPDPAERRQTLRELAALNPTDVDHRLALVRSEIEFGDAAAALKECDALLVLIPDWPPARYLREQARQLQAGVRPTLPPDKESDGSSPREQPR